MIRIISIIILALLGIFIHPFAPGTIDFIYRFIIFAVITYITYTSLRATTVLPNDVPEQEFSVKAADNKLEFEFKEDWNFEDLLQNDERTYLYLKDQFDILASMLFPDNGWIFYKKDVKVLKKIFNKTFSDNIPQTDSDEFEMVGLMEILDEKNEVLLENNLDKEANLLNFYLNQDYKAVSFIGIPVEIFGQEKIYIVFDSQNKEHFNREDQVIINKLRENIQVFILNRVKAYSLLNAVKEKENLLEFAQELNGSRTVSMAIEKMVAQLSKEFEASRLTVSLMSQKSDVGIIKKVVGQKDDFIENHEFSLEEGLTGWVMSKNKPYLIDDLEKGEYFIPRYTKTEKTNFGLRSFIGVPIENEGDVFGALTLEHRITNKYGEKDKEKLKNYIKIFATTFLRQKQ
jgi:transcriptional regulator with GAF, ATPase, and Fis domain